MPKKKKKTITYIDGLYTPLYIVITGTERKRVSTGDYPENRAGQRGVLAGRLLGCRLTASLAGTDRSRFTRDRRQPVPGLLADTAKGQGKIFKGGTCLVTSTTQG